MRVNVQMSKSLATLVGLAACLTPVAHTADPAEDAARGSTPALSYNFYLNDTTGHAGMLHTSDAIDGISIPARWEVTPYGGDTEVFETNVGTFTFGNAFDYPPDHSFLIRYSNPLLAPPGQVVFVDNNFSRKRIVFPVDGRMFGMEPPYWATGGGDSTVINIEPFLADEVVRASFFIPYFSNNETIEVEVSKENLESEGLTASKRRPESTSFALCLGNQSICPDYQYFVHGSAEQINSISIWGDHASTQTVFLSVHQGEVYFLDLCLDSIGGPSPSSLLFPDGSSFGSELKQEITVDNLLAKSDVIGILSRTMDDNEDRLVDSADLIAFSLGEETNE